MKKLLESLVRDLQMGDLVRVRWCDASVGKSLSTGVNIDVPVVSWGIYLGVLGEKAKHVILAQSTFRYSDGFFDLDFVAIPLQWSVNITILAKDHVQAEEAKQMLNSFLMGGRRTLIRKIRQLRVTNHHDGLD